MAAAVLAGLGSWWIVSLPPFSGTATATVLLAGVSAIAAGNLRPQRETAQLRWPKLVPWLVLAGAGAAWQLASYLQHPRSEHPTLSSLTNALLDSHPARTAAFALWLAGAYWMARR